MRRMNTSGRWTRRRGVTIIQLALCAVVVVGFIALGVDVGQLYNAQGELHRAADAAALAGTSGLLTDAALGQDIDELTNIVHTRTQYFSLQNETLHAGTVVDVADILLGTFDFNNRSAGLDTSGLNRINAVQVTERRTPDSANGGVPFFFAKVLGIAEGGVTATTIAAFDDRFSAFEVESSGGTGPVLLPFTKQVTDYEAYVVGGNDVYAYSNGVQIESDGIPEVILYPSAFENSNGNGNNGNGNNGNGNSGQEGASGNFGLLNFRGNNTPAMISLINDGVTAEDLQDNLGTTELVYVDDSGDPNTYSIDGTPGLDAALESAIQQYVGQVVGFFVHDVAAENGNNAVYQNVGIRFGRLMHVELNGQPKELVIQPAAVTGSGVHVSSLAPSSDGMIGRIVLVR